MSPAGKSPVHTPARRVDGQAELDEAKERAKLHVVSVGEGPDVCNIDELLDVAELPELCESFKSVTLGELAALDRTALLSKLKKIGLIRLSDRQKVANTIAKLKRLERLNLDKATGADSASSSGARAAHAADPYLSAPWSATPAASRCRAVLMPGQGAQKVGMADALLKHPKAAKLFKEASAVLGYDLGAIVAKGPAEKVDSTLYAQPAIFVTSLAALEVYKATHPDELKNVKTAAGFSLGEYTALCFGGGISFAECLKLVQVRAEAMFAATQEAASGMASIVGITDDAVLEKCLSEAKAAVGGDGAAYIANYMFPGGRTCSGDKQVLSKACELAKEAGASSAKLLAVSGAFHTPYMKSAAARLAEALDEAPLRMPSIDVISNVTAEPYGSVDEIRSLLKRQMLEPVKWEQTIRSLLDSHSEYLEPGPGKQLKAMLRRIDQKAWGLTEVLEK